MVAGTRADHVYDLGLGDGPLVPNVDTDVDHPATLQPSLVYVAVEEPLATIHWAAVDADLVVETIVSSITKESP